MLALLRAVDLALDELVDERRNLGVAAGALQRAQLEAQRRGVRARFLAQRLQHRERVERPPLLELHLGIEHQPRHREARRLRDRAGEVRLGRREVARVERRARRDQRGNPGARGNVERLLGELSRLAVAAFEQRDDRRIELRARRALLLAAAHRAHFARQGRRPEREPQQRVAGRRNRATMSTSSRLSDSSTRYGGATNST